MENEIARLQAECKALIEDNIRLLQEIRKLNNELDEYFMDRQILTHMVDDTTVEDEE